MILKNYETDYEYSIRHNGILLGGGKVEDSELDSKMKEAYRLYSNIREDIKDMRHVIIGYRTGKYKAKYLQEFIDELKDECKIFLETVKAKTIAEEYIIAYMTMLLFKKPTSSMDHDIDIIMKLYFYLCY